ncbi:MAG: response regulator transcription factor [Gemmatimonadaceae bacterium]|nr:response regulator transcription factor [Gemmatimonadaceae bacterium]
MADRPIADILLVEDHADLAYGLRRALEARGHRVTHAADGHEALTTFRAAPPQLLVLDLMLPGRDGFDVLHTVRAEGSRVPALILSARGEEADKLRGFRTGADDYVTKPFGLLELLARVDALLRRTAPPAAAPDDAPRGVQTFGEVRVDTVARSVTVRGAPVSLAPKELDLLLAFLRQPGVALTRAALLRDVWGHAPDIKTRTVDIHVAELRKKLEDDPTAPRHILTVWKTGYRFAP